jgi:C-terminal processing protease CtpA/Prc
MRNCFKALIIALMICFCIINVGNAKTLIANVTDSTGVVGIDMLIGAEAVPVINTVFSGSPAQEAGIIKGDRIVAIDNKPTYGLSSAEVDSAISDIPGTVVHFTILRNQQIYDFNVEVVPVHKTTSYIQQQFNFY